MCKKSEVYKDDFYKFVWQPIQEKKRELVLKKGPIVISSNKLDLEITSSASSSPSKSGNSRKRAKKNQIKSVDLQLYSREILKLRWNICYDNHKLFKIQKPKQKRLSKIKEKRDRELKKIKVLDVLP